MPGWAIVVAVVLALVPATALTAKRVFDSSSGSPADSSTDLPIPPVSTGPATAPPSSPGAPGSTPASTPASTPTTTPSTLHRIAPDAPRRLISGDVLDTGFDNAVTDLDASSDSEVARLESRGSPGSPGTDTVYVIGRVRADGDSAFAGLPDLEVGAKVEIRTDAGTLTYTVSATRLQAENALAGDPLFTGHKAGRLVLLGIRYDASGARLDKALVVTAQLSGAKRA